MGRPRKHGLDYFSFDTDFFLDPKIKILKARFGADGITMYVYLLCDIYRNGYYLEVNDDLEFILADELKMSQEKVKQVLEYLFSRSLLVKRTISTLAIPVTTVTSAGIQRRYQMAVKERALKNTVTVNSEVWLLSEEETETFIKVKPSLNYSEKNGSYSGKNGSYSEKKCIKESKVNKSKVKEKKPIGVSPSAASTKYFDDDELNSEFIKYLQVRREHGDRVTETQIQSLGNSLLKLTEDTGERIRIVQEALRHGWKDFYPLKKPSGSGRPSRPRGSFYNFEQRQYDRSLENLLLGLPSNAQGGVNDV